VIVSGKKQFTGLPELRLRKYSTKRRLERLGVIDVGSNSVRLVVFDGAARSPAYFFNEKIMCGLGAGVAQTGHLNPQGRVRALIALKRFVLLAKGMQSGPLFAVATAAVREASDGAEFCAEVTQATGLILNVASGKEEARLSAQGVLLGWPGAKGLMCDIGGSSMELAEISGGEVERCLTSPLGPLRLAQFNTQAEITAEISKRVATLRQKMSKNYNTLFLVGGSWRAIARLDMERRIYPLKVLHEYVMTPEDVAETVAWIGSKSVAKMRGLTGSSTDRLKLVPVASQVLTALLTEFRPDKIAVSSYGIREGLLYEQMPKKLRKRDPLIEASIHMERASARNPGFGKVLFDFLRPIFSHETAARKRLIRAACLLHDVTWRAHPDYRAEVCFDSATRANLGGLDHAGRVFLGMALLHRYKNNNSENGFEAVIGLLSAQERSDAAILGKAMRFGAMLSGASVQLMGQLRLHRKERLLELVLPRASQDLFGEVVQTRFESLSRSLECTTKVSIV
jgi:exopolyphosphatase/guanosine-5'-triphosphate,3'-diphosphate pyrophosphatase